MLASIAALFNFRFSSYVKCRAHSLFLFDYAHLVHGCASQSHEHGYIVLVMLQPIDKLWSIRLLCQ